MFTRRFDVQSVGTGRDAAGKDAAGTDAAGTDDAGTNAAGKDDAGTNAAGHDGATMSAGTATLAPTRGPAGLRRGGDRGPGR